MFVRGCVVLFLLASITFLQAQDTITAAPLIDSSNWQTVDLHVASVQLPSDFKRIERRCVHGCRVFESSKHLIVVTYGELSHPSPHETWRTAEFREGLIEVDGLTARTFSDQVKTGFVYRAGIPSDTVGDSIANITFESKDRAILELAPKILSTIKFKFKPKGPQEILFIKPCAQPIQAKKNPFLFEELITAIKAISASTRQNAIAELSDQITTRGVAFTLTPPFEARLRNAGANELILKAVSTVSPKELDEQVRIYELVAFNYYSSDRKQRTIAFEAGRKFLDRWKCDPLWTDQVAFIESHMYKLESSPGTSY